MIVERAKRRGPSFAVRGAACLGLSKANQGVAPGGIGFSSGAPGCSPSRYPATEYDFATTEIADGLDRSTPTQRVDTVDGSRHEPTLGQLILSPRQPLLAISLCNDRIVGMCVGSKIGNFNQGFSVLIRGHPYASWRTGKQTFEAPQLHLPICSVAFPARAARYANPIGIPC
jgi:hypothetical protein